MNNSKPLVSIIMGIYNCESTLEESIESIINQTYNNWQLVMCDDASSDNTYSIAEMYKKKYPEKIILIRNSVNMKLSTTLNNCLKYVTGKYVARMDGDDIALPTRLEKQVMFLENNKCFDLVGTAITLFDENGNRGIRKTVEKPNKETIFKISPFAHATIMCHRYVYDTLNGYTVSNRTIRGQDIDLWLRFYNNGFNGYNLQEPLYMVREDENAFKRRTIKAGLGTTKTLMYGVNLLGVSKKNYLLSLKPLISSIIPNKIMFLYHKRKSRI